MPSTKRSNSAPKPVTSADLQGLLKRVKATDLGAEDKASLSEILTQNIKMKKLVEKSTKSSGDKKVIVSLPNGFDIVK